MLARRAWSRVMWPRASSRRTHKEPEFTASNVLSRSKKAIPMRLSQLITERARSRSGPPACPLATPAEGQRSQQRRRGEEGFGSRAAPHASAGGHRLEVAAEVGALAALGGRKAPGIGIAEALGAARVDD